LTYIARLVNNLYMIKLSNLKKLKKQNKPLYIRTLMAANSGLRLLDLSIKLGVSTAMMSRVVHDVGVSRPIQQAIADACGVSYEHLWPDEKPRKKAA